VLVADNHALLALLVDSLVQQPLAVTFIAQEMYVEP
jgi:hypothetical protein